LSLFSCKTSPPSLVYSVSLSLSCSISLMHTHIIEMDYVRDGGNHLIVPFKFAFNRIGNSTDITTMGIPMCTGP
jgi:hypothetical protein